MQKRALAPDVLKLLACVGVIVIHISGNGLELFPIGSFSYLSSAFWDSLARFAVPVFFMCTGALMLPPERRLDAKTVWKKYFLRVLIILLFWSWAYYMLVVAGQYLLIYWAEENFFLNSITHTLRFDHFFHLYYLQILLLLYALLPVLRVFARAAGEKEMRYALGVWAVLGLAFPLLRKYPPLEWLGGITGQYDINMAWSAMGYAMLGYYLNTREASRFSVRGSALLFAGGFAVTFGGTVAASLLTGETVIAFMEGMSPGPAMMAAGLFCLVRRLCGSRSSSARIARLVKASFAVYLVHMAFVMVLRQFGLSLTLLPPLISVPVETAAVLALSLAAWWVLSKIPIVKEHLI